MLEQAESQKGPPGVCHGSHVAEPHQAPEPRVADPWPSDLTIGSDASLDLTCADMRRFHCNQHQGLAY
ncbi:hypothetical protein SRHO_G00081630 [Serrasalmus rhombeus]